MVAIPVRGAQIFFILGTSSRLSYLEKAVKDHTKNLALANTLFQFYKNDIAKIIQGTNEKILKIVAAHLSLNPNLDYMSAKRAGLDQRMAQDLKRLLDMAAQDIEAKWDTYRGRINLHGRMVSGYTARKVTPPWIPISLNLKDTRGRKLAPWKGLIHFHMQNLGTLVMRQVNQGLVAGEDLHIILQRVRKLLKIKGKKTAREAARPYRGPNPAYQDVTDNALPDQDSWSQTTSLFDSPPVEVTEGTYTLEDVDDLRSDQVAAMGWKSRAYTPDDEELWQANASTTALEQSLTSDVVNMLHEGEIQVGQENQGIKDFSWVVSKPQKECDSCTDRDGMTMTEIKEKFGKGVFPKGEAYPYDLTQDAPPPLHPFCYCQLIAVINDDWAGDQLEKAGYTWDSDKGVAYGKDANEQKAGFGDLSFDDWMTKVGGLQ